MGYGGNLQDAGQAVGQVGDGGIDGIIKEDRLGLDVIYIQAKRWDNTVGRPEIQKFVGALGGNRAKKGVFITTSGFSKEAVDFVDRIESKIVLIDGQTLAGLMVDHGVGVSTVQTYEVKKVDTDYFTEGVEEADFSTQRPNRQQSGDPLRKELPIFGRFCRTEGHLPGWSHQRPLVSDNSLRRSSQLLAGECTQVDCSVVQGGTNDKDCCIRSYADGGDSAPGAEVVANLRRGGAEERWGRQRDMGVSAGAKSPPAPPSESREDVPVWAAQDLMGAE
jgi:hypothetical protein